MGKSGQVHFRLVVNEGTKDVWGDVRENLGTYDPNTKKVDFKVDRIKAYLAQGAQPSDTVYNLLISQGIIEGKKRSVTNLSKKRRASMDDIKAKEEEAKQKAIAARAAAEEAAKVAEAKEKADAEAAEQAIKDAEAAKIAKENAPLVVEETSETSETAKTEETVETKPEEPAA